MKDETGFAHCGKKPRRRMHGGSTGTNTECGNQTNISLTEKCSDGREETRQDRDRESLNKSQENL